MMMGAKMEQIYDSLYTAHPWLHAYVAKLGGIRPNKYEDSSLDDGLQIEKGELERVVDKDARRITGIEPTASTESAQAYLEERHYLSGRSAAKAGATLREMMNASEAYRKK